MPTEYLSAEAVAAELGISVHTARRYFRDGGLPGRKVGKNWTTTREALDRWIAGGNALRVEDFTSPVVAGVPIETSPVPYETKP